MMTVRTMPLVLSFISLTAAAAQDTLIVRADNPGMSHDVVSDSLATSVAHARRL